jgi:mannose-1-phosphate guanylyltransferase/mannose-6-phosphate isomerase
LVNFIGQDSLVQSTVKRLLPIIDPQRLRIVCGREHRFEIARHMEALGIAAEGKIIAEPCGRNTAPAILLAALAVLQGERDALLCVFPADHVIREVGAFQERVAAAVRLAESGLIVTFGIRPHYPETGYGYIEGEGALPEGALRIRRFVEKPDLATARQYLASGRYFWNSGMFAFGARTLVAEFERHDPGMLAALRQMLAEGALERGGYERLADRSIDYAIMEQTDRGAVLPSDFGWSDIGSWNSLYEFSAKDAQGTVVDGDVLALDTRNCFLMGRERLIAASGLTGMVVVETPDAVFVSGLENSREVKQVVAELKRRGRLEYQKHKTVHHAWGSFTALEARAEYRVARLVLHAGACLPLAGAAGWRKHLTVIKGRGLLQGGERREELAPGRSLVLAPGETAELKNLEAEPWMLLELETPVAGG